MRHPSPFVTALGVVCLLAIPVAPATPRATLTALALSGVEGAQASEPRMIEVVAKRFAWEPAEIQVAVGERVRLVLRTADGLHGIELKKFKISKEIPRGNKPVTVDFTADAAGRFPFLCSEYCGDGHDDMKGVLVVVAKDAVPSQEPAAPQN
jgi:cytochrome c oxidase subunit II